MDILTDNIFLQAGVRAMGERASLSSWQAIILDVATCMTVPPRADNSVLFAIIPWRPSENATQCLRYVLDVDYVIYRRSHTTRWRNTIRNGLTLGPVKYRTRPDGITPHQMNIVRTLIAGKSVHECATLFGINEVTVSQHKRSVMAALDIPSEQFLFQLFSVLPSYSINQDIHYGE